MSAQVNIHEAKTHLSRLIARAAAGEEIVISKAGTPVAKLIRYDRPNEPRKLGVWAGKARILPGFDEMDEEIARWFESE